jgi:zinc D-Ala-D-Ala carboxypeptidase
VPSVTPIRPPSIPSVSSSGAGSQPASPPMSYVVQPGDTFWSIATRTLGDGSRWQEIWQLNKAQIPNPDSLQLGVTLSIPGAGAAQPTQPGYSGTSSMDPAPAPAGGTPAPSAPTAPAGSLAADPDLSYVASGGALKRTGEFVPGMEAVQLRLIALGYPIDLGPANSRAGCFGPATEAQLTAFQRDHALPATGALDRATLVALDAATPAPPVPIPAFPGVDEQGSQWVDKTRSLQPPGYLPPDLVGVDAHGRPCPGSNLSVRGIAQPALQAMIAAAARDGVDLSVVSAFRSYDTQVATYNYWVGQLGQAEGDRRSAKPGHSEHQLGLALDFNLLDDSFGGSKEGKWLAENAWKYGFAMSYPPGKESITGYTYEPWHFRYVGTELAASLHQSGQSLEEHFLS